MQAPVTTVEPAEEPVTLPAARVYVRAADAVDDDFIIGLIKSSRRLTEKFTGRRWVTQSLVLTLDRWPAGNGWVCLPVEPVIAVTGATYTDANGITQSLAGIQSWLAHSPPLVAPGVGLDWPSTQVGALVAASIAFTAGYGAAAAVPDDAKAAMLLCIGYWYEHRGDGIDPAELGLPQAALRLLAGLTTGSYL